MKAVTCTEWLLYHMWQTSSIEDDLCTVKLPDTIFYKWGQPYLWYFTSKNGVLLKKSKPKLEMPYILDMLQRKTSAKEVMAGQYYDCPSDEKIQQTKDAENVLLVKYFQHTEIGSFELNQLNLWLPRKMRKRILSRSLFSH